MGSTAGTLEHVDRCIADGIFGLGLRVAVLFVHTPRIYRAWCMRSPVVLCTLHGS